MRKNIIISTLVIFITIANIIFYEANIKKNDVKECLAVEVKLLEKKVNEKLKTEKNETKNEKGNNIKYGYKDLFSGLEDVKMGIQEFYDKQGDTVQVHLFSLSSFKELIEDLYKLEKMSNFLEISSINIINNVNSNNRFVISSKENGKEDINKDEKGIDTENVYANILVKFIQNR